MCRGAGKRAAATIRRTVVRYYVSQDDHLNGDNEVHKKGCRWMPDDEEREYLGCYDGCKAAVAEANTRGYKANGCPYCCPTCHTNAF
jgi:hypothetical protein